MSMSLAMKSWFAAGRGESIEVRPASARVASSDFLPTDDRGASAGGGGGAARSCGGIGGALSCGGGGGGAARS